MSDAAIKLREADHAITAWRRDTEELKSRLLSYDAFEGQDFLIQTISRMEAAVEIMAQLQAKLLMPDKVV